MRLDWLGPVAKSTSARTLRASRSLGAEKRRFPVDDLLGDRIGLARLTLGKLVHDVEHQAFHDRPKRPCSGPSRLGPPRNFSDGALIESQSGTVVAEEDFVLPGEIVFGLGQNPSQVFLGELVERGDDGEPADQFGDDAVPLDSTPPAAARWRSCYPERKSWSDDVRSSIMRSLDRASTLGAVSHSGEGQTETGGRQRRSSTSDSPESVVRRVLTAP